MTNGQVTTILTAVGFYLLLVGCWKFGEVLVMYRREARLRERTEAVRARARARRNHPTGSGLSISFHPGSSMALVRVWDEHSGRWYGFASLDDFARWSSSGLPRYLDTRRSEGERLTFSPSGSGWGRVLDHPALDRSRILDRP